MSDKKFRLEHCDNGTGPHWIRVLGPKNEVLVIGEASGYQVPASVMHDGETYYVCTEYFRGSLPVEEFFTIARVH